MTGIISGKIGHWEVTGEVLKEYRNGKVHLQVLSTDNDEWKRDLEKGLPVIISIKKDDFVPVVK